MPLIIDAILLPINPLTQKIQRLGLLSHGIQQFGLFQRKLEQMKGSGVIQRHEGGLMKSRETSGSSKSEPRLPFFRFQALFDAGEGRFGSQQSEESPPEVQETLVTTI